MIQPSESPAYNPPAWLVANYQQLNHCDEAEARRLAIARYEHEATAGMDQPALVADDEGDEPHTPVFTGRSTPSDEEFDYYTGQAGWDYYA